MENIRTLFIYLLTIFITYILGCCFEANLKNKEFKKIVFRIGKLEYQLKKKFFIKILLVFLPMIFVLGTRINTGADYEQYSWNFAKIYSVSNLTQIFSESKEPLYVISMLFVSKIFGNNVQAWFFFMAFMTFFVITIAINEVDNNINLPVFIILYGLYIYMYTFNYVRQLFAASLILLGMIYCLKNHKKRFVFCIVLATLMHRSSIVFLFFYFLKNTKLVNKNFYHIIIILSVAFIPLMPIILSKITFLSKYIQSYFDKKNFSFGIGFLIDVIPIAFLSIYMNLKKNDNGYLGNILTEMSWLIIPTRILSYYSYAAGRLFINVALIAIFGYSIDVKGKTTISQIYTILIFFLYFVYTFYVSNNCDVFPYTGIWL